MADWIIPCNPGTFDLFGAFDSLQTVDWRQRAKSIEKGDCVYIYVSAPVRAVAFRCRVKETMIPSQFVDRSDESFSLDGDLDDKLDPDLDLTVYMRLKPEQKIPLDRITLQKMRDAGLKGNIQGQRRVPDELRELFESVTDYERVYALLDEEQYSIMPPVRNNRPCQIPIRADRFMYLTGEFKAGTGGDDWVMFHHPGHFMIYDRNTCCCIVDASYGMFRDPEKCMDDEIAAVVFEMRLLQDKDGREERRGWDLVRRLMSEESFS